MMTPSNLRKNKLISDSIIFNNLKYHINQQRNQIPSTDILITILLFSITYQIVIQSYFDTVVIFELHYGVILFHLIFPL